MKHIPRFFTDNSLDFGEVINLSPAQIHHAFSVLRLSEHDVIHVFNERFGEWIAHVNNSKKGTVICDNIWAKPRTEKGPRLACCLINPNRFSMVLEKATELGVREIIPVISQFSQHRTINKDKCMQTIISAAEQCRRLTIPKLAEVISLTDFINHFPKDCTLLIGDTDDKSRQLQEVIVENCIFFVGPEGGFSDAERQIFSHNDSSIKKFYFGNNILRAETAAIAFLSNWVANYT